MNNAAKCAVQCTKWGMTTCKCYRLTRAGKLKYHRDLEEFVLVFILLPMAISAGIVFLVFYILSIINP